MPRTKSIKHCPRCDRDLPVSAFDARPRINGQSNGFRPRCRECTLPHGKSAMTARIRAAIPEPNPSGLCMCGCGGTTPLATQSHTAAGNVAGKPIRYIRSHGGTKDPITPDHYTVDPDTGCWVWNGATGARGYGQVSHHGRTRCAHIVFYEHSNGPVPDGLELDHLCRNRSCCNPDHLEAVTRVVNLRRGNGTKLTAPQVMEIRRLWKTGSYTRTQLGRMFGIASTTVQMVVYRRNWKDIP